ncbi:MAG: hypothetical protein HY425_01190 [Candidatus Levybacteria bacterium]|nr:hypothetical protein [Candidatus Levybacteria bacterium]
MKFKNIKKKAKKVKSPRNSRSITEVLRFKLPKLTHANFLKLYRGSLKVFVVFIFIVAVLVVGLDIDRNLQAKQEIDSQRKALLKDLSFWENFISKKQNYRDAYFQASILQYKLGNTPKAKMYTEKGLALDPNSENGLKIEEFLNK